MSYACVDVTFLIIFEPGILRILSILLFAVRILLFLCPPISFTLKSADRPQIQMRCLIIV